MRKRVKIRNAILICTIFAMLLVAIYSGLQILESTIFPSSEVSAGPSKTIVREGVEYFPRQDVTVVMLLGIDQFGPAEGSGFYKNEGTADTVMLLIFDETAKEYTVLQLNRDTIVDMPVLGLRGEEAGTYRGQLALAHTYGSGLEDSSENVKNTLMRFIHGLSIDYYVTMRMDAIPILNDAVGGVTVNVVDDFSNVNPEITKGEFTLRGDQALDFVRTRKDLGDQKNASRMERQKEYIKNFMAAMNAKSDNDVGFALDLYDAVSPYIITDCSAETLSSLLDRYETYTLKEVVAPQGDNYVAGGYFEFHVDEEAFDALILRLFYRPKQ